MAEEKSIFPSNHFLSLPLFQGLLALTGLICSVAAFLAPALWNGFPITFYDSGGYVDAVLEMDLVPGRSLFYGIFLWAGSFGWFSFWGPVVIQSILTVWAIYLTLRSLDIPTNAQLIAVFCCSLACLTGISWYTGQLMPDILIPLVVLSLWLLGFCQTKLSRPEKLGLHGLILLGLLSHMSCLALSIGLVLAIIFIRVLLRNLRQLRVTILPPTLIVLGGLILMPLLHLILVGSWEYTPGGPAFLLGRLVQDGIVQRWLAEHCPVPEIELCDLQDRFPETGDEFLWDSDSPFQNIGGWAEADGDEVKFLVRQSILSYPGMFLLTGIRATGQQLILVATGEGFCELQTSTRDIFTNHLPRASKAFNSAHQQICLAPEIFDFLNLIHLPVSLFSESSLLVIVLFAAYRKKYDVALLAAFIFISLLGNAIICGVLSNPHDRYQSRVVWLAPLVLGIALVRWSADRAPKQST
jgi:hypothetical protein